MQLLNPLLAGPLLTDPPTAQPPVPDLSLAGPLPTRPLLADLPLAGLLFPHGRLYFRYEPYRVPPKSRT